MKLYEPENDEDFLDAITNTIEKDTDKKIFTLRVLSEDEKGLDTIIIFEDRSVLMGKISIQTIRGKLACRLQGDWI